MTSQARVSQPACQQSFDLMNGPTRYGPITHQEFVAMSQPKEPGGHVGLADVGKAASLEVA